jgi:hypothetical protein
MSKKLLTETITFQKVHQMAEFTAGKLPEFDPGSRAFKAGTELIDKVEELKTLTAGFASLEHRLAELFQIRKGTRRALLDEMRCLYRTAYAIGKTVPGFDSKFQMSLLTDWKLLNAARSALRDAEPHAEIFINHALPSDFLEQLSRAIRNFEQSRQEHENSKAEKPARRKTLRQKLQDVVKLATSVDAIMQNTFRNDPIKLATWKDACRVAPAPEKKQQVPVEPTPPEAPPLAQSA